MRQIAWLHSHPRNKEGKAAERSRLETMEAKGDPPLIPHNPAPYLTDWLFDAGPASFGGMSQVPLSYQDLAAWQTIIGVELLPWEARLLRRLSAAYVSESIKAEEIACPAPYIGEVDDLVAKRAIVSQQVKAAFGQLKRKEG